MAVLALLVWLVSALAVGLTLLPLWNSPKWWVRLWDYPRQQLAAVLAAAMAAQAVVTATGPAGYGLLAASGGCLAWHVYQIHRYTPLRRKQSMPAMGPRADNDIRLMIANVLQTNRRADAFLAIVERCDPDIVMAVETDDWWDAQLAGLRQRYPFSVRRPQDNTYGMVLYSRLTLLETRVLERVSPGIPSIAAVVRLRSGRTLVLHCLHPEPPLPSQDVDARDAELLLVAKEVAKDDRPTVVAGDLNDVAWSHTTRLFQRISRLLDPRIGRGLFSTFHAEHRLARWPLDHIFHDAHFTLRELKVLGYFGSDHFPIVADLVMEERPPAAQEVPQPDAADMREASEKIADAKG